MAKLVGVIGCGNVGFSHLCWLASKGWNVIGFDTSPGARSRIVEALSRDNLVNDFEELSSCSAVHVCVPTDPGDDGAADLLIIEDIVDRLAYLEQTGADIEVVSQRSTCPPGTAERFSRKFQRIAYGVNPSFLRKSSIERDTRDPERLAYGGPSEFLQHMDEVYVDVGAPVFRSASATVVEALKYVENALDALLLSFWNEMLLYAQAMDMDAADFCRLVNHIGDRPKFASAARVPGRAFGLWCLPKDLSALLFEMNTRGVPVGTLDGAKRTNDVIRGMFGEGRLGSTELFLCEHGQVKLTKEGIAQITAILGAS